MPEKDSISTKSIGELKNFQFFVPAYQRGYRWTKDEVEALLNDINDFSTVDGNRYCIQPLIVKKRDDETYEIPSTEDSTSIFTKVNLGKSL